MLGFDLAEMYEVETRVLKQAVRRSDYRFPGDFMFQLAKKECYKCISSYFEILLYIRNKVSGYFSPHLHLCNPVLSIFVQIICLCIAESIK